MTEAEDLRAKVKARKGRPGFRTNVMEMEARLAHLEALRATYRDKATGQFVTAEYALANPETTYRVETGQ